MRFKSIRACALFAFAAMTASAPAAAQGAPSPFDPAAIERGMDQLSGMIVARIFEFGDVDRDGYVTPTEMARVGSSMAPVSGADLRTWAFFDADRDGRVSRAEMRRGIDLVRSRTKAGQRPF